jgi:hypothetical protein
MRIAVITYQIITNSSKLDCFGMRVTSTDQTLLTIVQHVELRAKDRFVYHLVEKWEAHNDVAGLWRLEAIFENVLIFT